MAEPFDDTVDRERRDIGIWIFKKREAGLRRTDFGNGGGERTRQQGATGDDNLRIGMAGGEQIDEILVAEQRRTRQKRQRDIRLIGGERMHDDRRRFLR